MSDYHERMRRLKAEYSQAYERWTEAEEDRLRHRYQEGVTIATLVEEFQRQPGAIRSRLRKLGLLPRSGASETATTKETEEKYSTRHYFVDEAGDGTLFSRKGKIIIGNSGCSNFFILGFVDIPDPERMGQELSSLRKSLLADPYFRDVPSIQPERKKTAFCFHAKDDVPEVRREVFSLLYRYVEEIRFFAVVRDKREVLSYVRQRNERDYSYRYNPNELYDFLVRQLFQNVLHKDDEYHICFARRGASDRTEALRSALKAARNRFYERWGRRSDATINVVPSTPVETTGLQVADYFLWALQRLYERGEERYVAYLQPALRFIHDIDDTREMRYGVYYTRKKPLTRAALEKRLYLLS